MRNEPRYRIVTDREAMEIRRKWILEMTGRGLTAGSVAKIFCCSIRTIRHELAKARKAEKAKLIV